MRFTLVIMYPRGSKYHEAERGQSSSTASNAKVVSYVGAYEELFRSNAGMKVEIVSHPLFEQLVAAHVACLRAGTPLEEQHIIDSALAKRDHVEAKYRALLSHLHSVTPPADKEELNLFMVDYILLLQSFKENLLKHLRTEASEAISSCQKIEHALFNLTGVSLSSSSRGISTITQEDENESDDGLCHLGINAFLQWDIPIQLRDHIRRELKQELNKDYYTKLKEVRDEILRKRRAGRLPDDTTHLLKDWWITHAKWPYPTEEEKAQLMVATGLDLKQINNWFINQRKRKWQIQRNNSKGDITDSCNIDTTLINPISMELSLNSQEETSFP